MLKIKNLKKKLGHFSLSVDDMQINSGGIYGIIGHNGCGKSTLAKLISGILQPDSGNINIEFDNKEITMVTQKPYIMDDTVYKNLEYPLKLRGIKNSALCDDYLEKIGFLERKNQQARGLSGGEKQKLAMLRAMIFDPKLIILDETMTDLDLDSLDIFEQLILERQKKEPVIWILISHQLALIRRLCDYVFSMSNGRIQAEGQTEEIFNSQNPHVKRFIKMGEIT